MQDQKDATLAPMVRKLQLWKELDADEQAAVLALPHKVGKLAAGDYIVREGEQADHSCLLLSGFAYRQKVSGDGGRSISAVQMQGDLVDLQNSLLGTADHSVQTLSRSRVAFIPRQAIINLAFAMPSVGMAMWYDTLVDGSIFREWVLNVSRRDASTRIAHLLCEFGIRFESLGLGERYNYDFPMTQSQLADATGLTNVHVNRSLQALEAKGLIARTMRHITVANWPKLQQIGDFDDAYLHLTRVAA